MNMYAYENDLEKRYCESQCPDQYHAAKDFRCAKDSDLSNGAIAGIAVGCALFLAVIIILIVCLRKRAVAKKTAKEETKMRK